MLHRGYRALHTILIGLGAVPLVIWSFYSRSVWPELYVGAYLLTAYHILMLVLDYPGPGNLWYWKLVMAMIILHCVVLFTLAMGALAIVTTGIRPPTAMFFGLVGGLLVLESWARVRLFTTMVAKAGSPKRRRFGHRSSANNVQ